MLIRLAALELASIPDGDVEHDLYQLTSLHVSPDGVVCASDGRVLLRMRAAAQEPSLFDALLPADERGFEGEVLVDAGDAKDFKAACNKALKKAGKKKFDDAEPVHVVIAKEGDQLSLALADGIVVRRFDITQSAETKAKYPNVDRILAGSPVTEVSLSVDLLLKTLRVLKRLKVSCVTFGVLDDSMGPVHVRARSTVCEVDGAIMPMRIDPPVADEPPARQGQIPGAHETGPQEPDAA